MTAHIDRILTLPGHSSVFLFGPRGTGKSTWLRRHFPDALYLDLLDPSLSRTLLAGSEHLEALVSGSTAKTIIIDEVQKIPSLLEVVHRIMESDDRRRFILTGSSARKLKRAGVDLLAGRALFYNCFPFMAAELEDRFDLEEALLYGTIPVIFSSENKRAALASYLTTYVDQEVRQEGIVRNIGHFHRFLEVLSFSHGSLLNTSEISRECEVPRKTVESFISVVEDLLLGYRLPVFSRRAKRVLIKQNKFYFVDQGIYSGLRPKGALDSPSEIFGAALEGLVFQHLKSWLKYFDAKMSLYFWRTRAGVEVDFILYGEDGFFAIEVKNSATVHRKDLAAMRSFLSDYPEASGIFIYRGKETLEMDSIKCMPAETFLKLLDGHRSLL